MNTDTDPPRNNLASGRWNEDHWWVAAYLGHEPAMERLKAKAPARFSLRSMHHGGDKNWRRAMRTIGHKPAAFAACEIARTALETYVQHPDPPEMYPQHPEAPGEIGGLAADAVGALISWKDHPQAESVTLLLNERCPAFFLAVNVGGKWWKEFRGDSGLWRGGMLGGIVGDCYSVVMADSGLYVRSLGEAAEGLHRFGLDEQRVCRIISQELLAHLPATR
jgi:hypothetical protein